MFDYRNTFIIQHHEPFDDIRRKLMYRKGLTSNVWYGDKKEFIAHDEYHGKNNARAIGGIIEGNKSFVCGTEIKKVVDVVNGQRKRFI